MLLESRLFRLFMHWLNKYRHNIVEGPSATQPLHGNRGVTELLRKPDKELEPV
jgi:hypothetical protein